MLATVTHLWAVGEGLGEAAPVPVEPASTPAAAPATQLDAILEWWVRASGGRPAILSTTNLTAVGQAEAAHLASPIRCELYAAAPGQRVMSFHLPGQGLVIEGFDGESGWLDDPAFGRTEWTGEELAKRRREAVFHRAVQFRVVYPDLHVMGQDRVGSEPAWRVESHPSPAAVERFWFSRQSGLLLRHETALQISLGTVERSIEFAEYRAVAGVQFPHRWRIWQRGARQAEPEIQVTIQFEDVRFNSPIPEGRFRRGAAE